MSHNEIRTEIAKVCHRLCEHGVAGTFEGNVSVLCEDRIFLTPSQTSKEDMTPEQIIAVNRDGQVIEGSGRPTSEMAMHLKCYALRPDIHGIVHCHAPFATAYAQANRAIELHDSPEFLMLFGKVPVLKYGTPGTLDIIADLENWIMDYDTVLLQNHGLLSVGKTLQEAYGKTISLEMMLKTEFIRRSLTNGADSDLSEEEYQKLLEKWKYDRGYHPDHQK